MDNAIALKDTWFEARCKLITAAEKILGVLPASAEFRAANQEWLEVLKSFRLTSDQINSTVTQALDNLKKNFTASRPLRDRPDTHGHAETPLPPAAAFSAPDA